MATEPKIPTKKPNTKPLGPLSKPISGPPTR